MNPSDFLALDLSSWTAIDKVKAAQKLFGTTPDGVPGPATAAAWTDLIIAAANEHQSHWPFTVRVDGDDIVCDGPIVITCFGGGFDPQDTGGTASGRNTITEPGLQGVSVAMDGRDFSGLTPAEHEALDYAPIPRLPWGTLVEVTIGGQTLTPPDGIIDLGPGLEASSPGAPHALDLTVAAAALFAPGMSNRELATGFEARGSFRILGAAKYLSAG